jgi:hypothetical protein
MYKLIILDFLDNGLNDTLLKTYNEKYVVGEK